MAADLFPVGEYLQDELAARGWTTAECAARMGGDSEEVAVNTLALDMLIAAVSAPEGHAAERVQLGSRMADCLETAFGSSAEMWLNLDAAYHRRVAERDSRKAGA